MQLSPPRQIAVFGNIHQPSKGQYVEEILHQLMNHGFQIAIEQRFDHYITRELGINTTDIPKFNQATPVFDMAISVGGDGTFLNTAAHIKDLGIPILGINTGRLGFMADVSLSHIDQAIHALINGQYRIEERSVIHASTNGLGFKSYPYALNEVAILKHDNASLIEIEVTINGSVLTNYLADGIIVSTPTGSTGYSLSAGGPIMVPDSRNFCISAVAPHSLYIRPAFRGQGLARQLVEIAPDLGEAIKVAQQKGRTIKRTVYQYPPNLLTTQGVLALARNGVPYVLPRREAVFIRALDAMRAEKKEAFGGALLISDAAAARKAAAEQTFVRDELPTKVWHLSEREQGIIQELNKRYDQSPCAAP